MNVFIFDIETVPDVASGKRLYQLDKLNDSDAAQAMMALRQEKTGSDFLPLHLQRIVCISAVLKTRDNLAVWSLGENDTSEAELIERFFAGIERYSPMIVSWNGSGFDLPVIHYRSLHHGISAPRYWETGDSDQSFRWNNYLNRYHSRHLDLMDVLAGYTGRANAPLDEIAGMCGFPGKMGMSGAKVWDAFQAGDIDGIRNYCETDVLNTYLVYCRFEKIRGNLSQQQYDNELQILREYLAQENKPHFTEFSEAWT